MSRGRSSIWVLNVLRILEAEGFELSLCSTLKTTRRAGFGASRF
jgi:hypothetical protein